MSPGDIIFTGIDISSGPKHITYAALDRDLNVMLLETGHLSRIITNLEQYKQVILGVTLFGSGKAPSAIRETKVYAGLKKWIAQAGFKPYLTSHAPRQWVETNLPECFRQLASQTLLPRPTLGGKFQRALILYDQGLQINDPMQFFEEISRQRLMMGVLPTELLYSASELDALAAAYVVWLLVNKPVRINLAGDMGEGMIWIPRQERTREIKSA